MKQTAIVFLWIIVGVAAQAQANATCVSVLTDRQQLDLDAMIFLSNGIWPIVLTMTIGRMSGLPSQQRRPLSDPPAARASPPP